MYLPTKDTFCLEITDENLYLLRKISASGYVHVRSYRIKWTAMKIMSGARRSRKVSLKIRPLTTQVPTLVSSFMSKKTHKDIPSIRHTLVHDKTLQMKELQFQVKDNFNSNKYFSVSLSQSILYTIDMLKTHIEISIFIERKNWTTRWNCICRAIFALFVARADKLFQTISRDSQGIFPSYSLHYFKVPARASKQAREEEKGEEYNGG